MLFAVIYKPRGDWSEENQKRSLQLFTNWKPPAGFQFKAHYACADGGGVAIAEADTAAAAIEATTPFETFFEFKVTPCVDITEAVPIIMRVQAWRDSVR